MSDLSNLLTYKYCDPEVNKLYYVLAEGTNIPNPEAIHRAKKNTYNTICKYCSHKNSFKGDTVPMLKCVACGRKWNLNGNTIEGTFDVGGGTPTKNLKKGIGKFDPVDAEEYEEEHALPPPKQKLYKHEADEVQAKKSEEAAWSPPQEGEEWTERDYEMSAKADKVLDDIARSSELSETTSGSKRSTPSLDDLNSALGLTPAEKLPKVTSGSTTLQPIERKKAKPKTSSEPKIKEPRKTATKTEGVIEELSPDITLKELMSLIKDQKGDLTSTIKVKKGDILQFGEKLFIVK